MDGSETYRKLVRRDLINTNEFPTIPDSWGVERLRFLFRESKERNGSNPVGQMLSVSEYRGVVPREYDNEEQKRTDAELETYRVVRPGQLAVNSMWLNHLGLGVSDHEGHVSPAYEVYDISDRLDRRFVHHLMRSEYYLKIYLRYLYGIRPNSFQIKAHDWKSIPIIVPDLATQRQIADFLDRETARIDLLIEKKQRLVALLGEKWRADLSETVKFGEHSTQLLKRMIAYGSSISYGIVQPGDPVEEGVPFIQTANLVQRQLSLDELPKTLPEIAAKYPRSKLKPGDVLLGIRASIGQSIVVTPDLDGVNLSRGIAKISPSEQIAADFLCITLELNETAHFWSQVQQGSTFREISIEAVRSLPVPVPPLLVQNEICRIISEKRRRYTALVKSVEYSITRLREYRSALITAAVTGQIDVTEHNRAGTTERQLDAIAEEMGA